MYNKLKHTKKPKPTSRVVLLDYNDLISPLADFFLPAVTSDIVMKEGKPEKPDAVVMWNDVMPDYQMLCKASAMHKIPTFVVQHGRGAARDYLNKENPSQPLANAFIAWGTKDEEQAKKAGFESVFRVGFPGFAYRPQKAEEKGTVVYDALHWDTVIDENQEAWTALRKIDSIKPIAKLLRAQGINHAPEKFPGLIVMTDQLETGHLIKTYDLLKKASVVVCLIEGTLELMAYSLDIPVIQLDILKERDLLGRKQDKEDYKPSEAAEPATLENLEEKVKYAVAHPEHRRAERRKVLLEEGGDPDTDTPFSSIVRIVDGLTKKRRVEAQLDEHIIYTGDD
jgi:hypothetical protein